LRFGNSLTIENWQSAIENHLSSTSLTFLASPSIVKGFWI
jgi:hypothetical protein